MFALLITQSIFNIPIFQGNETSPEHFARQFEDKIKTTNNHVTLSELGKKTLIEKNAWIQILDENGMVIYSFRTPAGIKGKYTPSEIVQMYKYKEINAATTIFVGEKKESTNNYSYFIGIENPNLNRYFISYDNRDINQVVKVVGIVLILDIFIALLIGYFFSKRLTQPLQTLINGIKRLANKDYTVNYESKGVYKDVFNHVNFLSHQLTANEKERKKLEMMRVDWIGNISHDIKTPLASIQGYAELIKDPDYHFSLEEIREYAEIIEQKSLYIKEVMEDLNLSTRLKNKALSLNKKTVNIVALLRNIVIDILNDPKYFSRIMILLSAVLGFILAVSAQKVIDLAYLAWDIIFVTIFWPIVLGPFWKRVSTPAVWASITAGLAYYIITSLTHVPGPKVESDGFIGLLSELWLVPGFSGVVISGITIVVVSLIIPPSQHVLHMHKIERDESLDEVGSKDEIEELKKATN